MSQFMVSFTGLTPPAWVLEGLRNGDISSLCLFAYNIASPRQLRELTAQLHEAARTGNHPPPLIGIDQEGGQLVAVTGGTTELPGNMALGATRSPELAEKAGRILGAELLAVGCNMNFAPVLDLSHTPDNPAVGVRAFSDDPTLVAELGRAMIRGMQATGIIATAKHFPGHGDTSTDSHYATPVVSRSQEALAARELVPFRAAIEEGIGAIMSAHICYPAFDTVPATLSSRILKTLLRNDLRFDGLIITDAMDMHALEHLSSYARNAEALHAGADLLLLGHLPDQAELIRDLRTLLEPSACERIRHMREHLPLELPSLEVVGCAEHRQIEQEIADASITVVRNERRQASRGQARLPMTLAADARVAVVAVEAGNLTPADTSSGVRVRLVDAIRARHANTFGLTLPYLAEPDVLKGVLQAAAEADVVIVGTVNAKLDPSQAELVHELHRRGKSPIVVALRAPYDILAFPFIETYLCAYSIRDASTEAVAKVLFGEIPARGQLPCSLPGIEVQDVLA